MATSRDLLTAVPNAKEPAVNNGPASRLMLPALLESKRRYAVAVTLGIAAAAVPYLWVLFDLWNNSPNFLRTAKVNGYASNFYDLQARAMFHGHLYVPNGSLGEEAFLHNGREYTYFGLFPSLLRMPFLLITHSLDGRLTAPSMLLAWLVTGLCTSLLIWRIRYLVRGTAILTWVEAAAYGVFVATVMAGSVLIFLASDPWVFSEDLAWSVALTIGVMFALLGVLERPTWLRIAASGLLLLAAELTRATTGYACVIGAGLVAVRFALGYGGAANRHWALPIAIAGVVPLGAGCAIEYAKFGVFFGLPASDQLLYRYFGISGSYFGIHFLPSTLNTYFRPPGVRFTPAFPFVTLPASPAHGVDHVALFGGDRSASVLYAMPLLVSLSLWGGIRTCWRRPPGRSVLLRPVLAAAFVAGGTVMIFGWIENRFTADFLPFFVVAGAVGMVEIWHRLERSRQDLRTVLGAAILGFGLYGISANAAMASTPQGTWSSEQTLHFVEAQKAISDVTGHPQLGKVVKGTTLPDYAPADELFVVGNCAGLYISDGANPQSDVHTLPDNLLQSLEWLPVEVGPSWLRTLNVTVRGSSSQLSPGLPIVSFGAGSATAIVLESLESNGVHEFRFVLKGLTREVVGSAVPAQDPQSFRISIRIFQNLISVSVTSRRGLLLTGTSLGHGRTAIHALPSATGQSVSPVTVSSVVGSASDMSLCRTLAR